MRLGILGIILYLIDLSSKYFTYHYIPSLGYYLPWYPYGGIAVFKNFLGIEFSINHVTNRGGAWGLFAEYQDYLLAFRIALIVGLFFYIFFMKTQKGRMIPLLLILVGALGNVTDYFLYGSVIDMFHFKFWGYDYPVFNFADSMIFIGIVWLFIQTVLEKRKPQLKVSKH